MHRRVALLYEVDSIFQLPAGLGVGDRGDGHRTWGNVDPCGIAEATAVRGHGYLCAPCGGMSTPSRLRRLILSPLRLGVLNAALSRTLFLLRRSSTLSARR